MPGGEYLVPLDRSQIEEIIPHRDPFSFIDRIVELEPGIRAVGMIDDIGRFDLLRGHFPGFPVMPGTLLAEALAQVGAVAALGLDQNRGKIAILTGLDQWRFRIPILPGHQIRLEISLLAIRSNYGRGLGVASVKDQIAAKGVISFAIIDKPVQWQEV